MSGGRFNYDQYKIIEMYEYIQSELDQQGQEVSPENRWMSDEWYEKHPEDLYYEELPDKVQEAFKQGIKALKRAYVYAQRIDWYLSGDDGHENFIKRLEQELNQIESE